MYKRQEKNIKLDINQYFEIVKKNKEKQKNSWTGSGEKSSNKFFLELKNFVKKTEFVGYNEIQTKAELQCIINDEKFLDEVLVDKNNIFLVFNKTHFMQNQVDKLVIRVKLRLKVESLFVISQIHKK